MSERNLNGGKVHLEGAIDMHVHFGPEKMIAKLSQTVHSVDPIQAASEAADIGMRALVLKPHEFSSSMPAYHANREVKSVTVFAGICCDYPVGGLNPVAVETALINGAKVVWMPTVSSRQSDPAQISLLFGTDVGIAVTDDEGEIVQDAQIIMDLVHQYDAILATGHTTKSEHFALARAYGRRGRLLVTHAMQEGFGPGLTKGECVELAELGANIEFTAHSCMGAAAGSNRIADAIQAVGKERVVLSSDYGWSPDIPHPAPGFQNYVDALWEAGVPEEDLSRMVCDNPARLLSLTS